MRYAYNAVGNLLQRSTTDGSGVKNPGGEFYEKWLNTTAAPPDQGGDGITAPVNHPHAFGETDSTATAPSGETRRVRATYDANGNMKTLEVEDTANSRHDYFEYTWDHYDRLITVRKYAGGRQLGGGGTLLQGAEAHYLYDCGGQRVAKLESSIADTHGKSTLYITKGVEIVDRYNIYYVFYGKHRIVRIIPRNSASNRETDSGMNAGRVIFEEDSLKSITISIVDVEIIGAVKTIPGKVSNTVSYLPYGGKERFVNRGHDYQSQMPSYLFSGKEYNSIFNLYNFGSRLYVPYIGRFLSVDAEAIKGGKRNHSYLYVDGRLFDLIDPDGRAPKQKNSNAGLVVTGSPIITIEQAGIPELSALAKHKDFEKNLVQAVVKRLGRYTTGNRNRDVSHVRAIISALKVQKVKVSLWLNVIMATVRENFGGKHQRFRNQLNASAMSTYRESMTRGPLKRQVANKYFEIKTLREAESYQNIINIGRARRSQKWTVENLVKRTNNGLRLNDLPHRLGIAIRIYLAQTNTQLFNIIKNESASTQRIMIRNWMNMTPAERAGIAFLAGSGATGIPAPQYAAQLLKNPRARTPIRHNKTIERQINEIVSEIRAKQATED
jgi:RHS repeat-associated protein